MEDPESLAALTPEERLAHEMRELYTVLQMQEPMPVNADEWRILQQRLIARRADVVAQLSQNDREGQRLTTGDISLWERINRKRMLETLTQERWRLAGEEQHLARVVRAFEFLVPGAVFEEVATQVQMLSPDVANAKPSADG